MSIHKFKTRIQTIIRALTLQSIEVKSKTFKPSVQISAERQNHNTGLR